VLSKYPSINPVSGQTVVCTTDSVFLKQRSCCAPEVATVDSILLESSVQSFSPGLCRWTLILAASLRVRRPMHEIITPRVWKTCTAFFDVCNAMAAMRAKLYTS